MSNLPMTNGRFDASGNGACRHDTVRLGIGGEKVALISDRLATLDRLTKVPTDLASGLREGYG